MDHIRKIDELLDEISKINNAEEKRRYIKNLFYSEWRPEYIAGAIALGKQTAEDWELHDFLIQNLPNDLKIKLQYRKIAHKSPQPTNKENPHWRRHALIALAACGNKSHAAGNETPEISSIVAESIDWLVFCHASELAYRQNALLKSIDHYPGFEIWCKHKIEKFQNALQKTNEVLEKSRRKETKNLIGKKKFDIKGLKKSIEDSQKKLNIFKRVSETSEIRMSDILSFDDLPKYQESSMPLPSKEWEFASFQAGLGESISDVKKAIDYAQNMVDSALTPKSPEITPQQSLNIPLILYRLLIKPENSEFIKDPKFNHRIKKLLDSVEQLFPELLSTKLDACNFAMDLAKLRLLVRGNIQSSHREVIVESAKIIAKNFGDDTDLKNDVVKLKNALESNDNKKIQEAYRLLLEKFCHLFSDHRWHILVDRDQRMIMNATAWLLIYFPAGVRSNSGLMRIERRLDRAIELLHTSSIKSENFAQFCTRLVKELYFQALREKEKDYSREEFKTFIKCQLVKILFMLEGWGWSRTIPKDLSTILLTLLEKAESLDHSFFSELIILSQYAHIDLKVIEEAINLARKRSILNYLESMKISETLLLSSNDSDAIMGCQNLFELFCGDKDEKKENIAYDRHRMGKEIKFKPEGKKGGSTDYLTKDGKSIQNQKDMFINCAERNYRLALFYFHKHKSPLSKIGDLISHLSLNDSLGEKEWERNYYAGIDIFKNDMINFLIIRRDSSFFQKNDFVFFIRDKKKKDKISCEMEINDFKLAQKIEVVQEVARLDRLLQDICRLVRLVRHDNLPELKDRQRALRELLSVLADYKAWCQQHLPYLMQNFVFFNIDKLIEDIDNHREISSRILTAMAQKNYTILNDIENTFKEKKALHSDLNKLVTYFQRYIDIIVESKLQIAMTHENESGSENKVKEMFHEHNQIIGDRKKGNPAVLERSINKLEKWMYSRYMFKELSDEYKQNGHFLRKKLWWLYQKLLMFRWCIFLLLFPYLFYITSSKLNLLPSIVFSLYIIIVLLLALSGVFWVAKILIAPRDTSEYAKRLSPFSMFIPKVIGLLFISTGALIASDEYWKIAININPVTAYPLTAFFCCCLFIFIRQVLLKDQNIKDTKITNQRSSGILSLILIESYLMVLFFSTLRGRAMSTELAGVDSIILWLPNKIPLTFLGGIFPAVYPHVVLLWTVQVAFIGIVLQLFLTREKLIE